MHNVISDSFETTHDSRPRISRLPVLCRPGLLRTVIAPLALLVFVAVGGLIAEFALHRGIALSEQKALHLGCVFAAVALGSLGATAVLRSRGFDLSAGPILFLALTIVAWGIKEDVAVICMFGDNLRSADEKWHQNQAEIDARKAGRGWETLGDFHHSVARNSRLLERLQYIRKSGKWYTPFSPVVAVLLALGAALALGVLNGAMVRWLSIPSLFGTLGTSVVALSCAQYISNSTSVRPAPEQIPYWVGLPQPGHVCLALGAAIVVGLLLRFGGLSTTGAVGISESATWQNEPRSWSTMTAYCLAGLLAGLAGICLVPSVMAGGALEGLGWELRIIAAACIGGAMLNLWRGVVWGTLIGAAVIALIDFGGAQLGIVGPVRDVVLVALFMVVLTVDRLSTATLAPSTVNS